MKTGKIQMPMNQFLAGCLILGLIGFNFVLHGCVKEDKVAGRTKEGRRYGVTAGLFQGRWYHYYERGLSFAEGEFWIEAERDLRKALQLRDGDQRRAKTYGMHFIDEYFPHRELGIVLFYQKRYDEAIKELEISLVNTLSAKAEYYLDKARQAKLLIQKTDTAAPEILITTPDLDHRTNRQMIRLTGLVRDNTFVKTVQVNGNAIRIDLSAPEVRLDVEIPLQSGENSIVVAAVDIVGNSSRVQRTVLVDRVGPVISLKKTSPNAAGKLLVKGFIHDESNLAGLTIDGRAVSIPRTKEFELEHYVAVASLQTEIFLVAADALGNKTKARIDLAGSAARTPSTLLAATDIWVLAENRPSPGKSKEVTLPRDNIKPVIELEDWDKNQTVYLNEAYLAGYAHDNEWVESLMLNEKPLLRHPGQSVFFNYLPRLEIGPNAFRFEAWDRSGNQSVLSLNIERKKQEIRDIGDRMSLVMTPFLREGRSDRFGAIIEEILLSQLVKSNRFQMVSAPGLDPKILKNPADAARVGQERGVNYILTGRIIEDENSLDIFVKVIETNDALILTSQGVYEEQINRRALKTLCRGLVVKLVDDLPLVEGKVIEAESENLRLEFGGDHRIVKGMRCILFREKLIFDEQTERIVDRHEVRLGSALITAVQKKSANKTQVVAEIYEKVNAQIAPGHLVITK